MKSSDKCLSTVLAVVMFFAMALTPVPGRNVYAEELNKETTQESIILSTPDKISESGQTDFNVKESQNQLKDQDNTASLNKEVQPTESEDIYNNPAEAYEESVSAYVDERGFLTDAALESFTIPLAEEEQFYDVTQNADGSKELKLYLQPIKHKNSKNEWVETDESLVLKDAKKNGQ